MQFRSFGEMADYLQTVVNRVPTAQRQALTQIGGHLQSVAKGKLGQYQPQAGPFQAWPALAAATLANSKRQAATEGQDSPLFVTGKHILDTIQARVVMPAVHVGTDDEIAGYQELGTSKIPPRSFLGSALFEEAPKCVHMLAVRIHALIQTGR